MFPKYLRVGPYLPWSRVSSGLLFLATLVACDQPDPDDPEPEPDPAPFSVALLLDATSPWDNGFNQAAYEGARTATSDPDIELHYALREANRNHAQQIEDFAQSGSDLLIGVGFALTEAIQTGHKLHPDLTFALIDVEGPPAENVTYVSFREDQLGFLAGVLSGAMANNSRRAACIGGMEIVPVRRFCNGFRQGLAYACSDCQALIEYTGTFDDRRDDDGDGVAEVVGVGAAQVDLWAQEGLDVLFNAAGATGSNALLHAASQYGTWVIGVDLDEYETTFHAGAQPGANKVLTSAIKHVDRAVAWVIESAREGTLEGGSRVFSLSGDEIGLASFHAADAAIPEQTRQRLADVRKQLGSGALQTGVDFESGQLQVQH